MTIELKQVSKKINQEHWILKPLTISFPENSTTILIGPSGSGKSTLLKILVGLIEPTTGRVFYDDTEMSLAMAQNLRQKIGYVIQEGGLFPHLKAGENITLLSNYLKINKIKIKKKLNELCQLVNFPTGKLNMYPLQLSGGERQRVSLMRALMLGPDYIFLDEPLASLDPIARYELQIELKEIFQYLKKTVIMVTHDMYEAAFFDAEIILMSNGEIIQKGTYRQLYLQPSEPFVSTFIRAQQPPKEILR